MKICNKCKCEKEESDFSFKNKKKQIRSTTCSTCSKKYGKQHYLENKSKYVERAKDFNRIQIINNRQKMIDYLNGKKCKDCGNSDIRVLEFDHKKNVDKSNNIGNMLYRNCWTTILKEIGKCEIRCANCHRIKTTIQFDYFKNNLD